MQGGGNMRELKVEVSGIHERCGAKLKVGDTFYVRGGGLLEVPRGKKVCLYALNSLFPFLTAKQREDELPKDDWVAETEILNCPDPKGVSFKITVL
jgi:carbon-monoxide dehydrogenase iron sulfur subunit